MSRVVHHVIVTLTYDKAAPPRQAATFLRRLLEGAPLEQAIYETSLKNENNAAPVRYSVQPLSQGLLRPIAETTDRWDDDDEASEAPPVT